MVDRSPFTKRLSKSPVIYGPKQYDSVGIYPDKLFGGHRRYKEGKFCPFKVKRLTCIVDNKVFDSSQVSPYTNSLESLR